MGIGRFFQRRKDQQHTIHHNQGANREEALSDNMEVNLQMLKNELYYPKNKDMMLREIFIGPLKNKGYLLYLSPMVDQEKIEENMIKPLTGELPEIHSSMPLIEWFSREMPVMEVLQERKLANLVTGIMNGSTLLLLDGMSEGYLFSTVKLAHRSVSKAQNESVIKGPQEAFVESAEVNRALIRKRLRNRNLITESLPVGNTNLNEVLIMYIQNIATDQLVHNVKDRIKQIEVDSLQGLEILEQHLEERPYSLVPTILYTERPDRAANFLEEGHVVIVMDNSPACLIAPVTFFSFFHTSEDMFERWAYGNFMRFLRMTALAFALFTPGFYLAITTYHHSMLQTDLLLAIAATREKIPFPSIIEVLLMELSFELIREAGVRIPSPIGATIGIVGALIIGQAAVDANLISQILVIVIAITGLSSFAIPTTSLGYMVRIGRFFYTFAAYFLGFFGFIAVFLIMISYLVSVKSFNVPFLSPLSPKYKSSHDTFFRTVVWKQWLRPENIQKKNIVRQKRYQKGSNHRNG